MSAARPLLNYNYSGDFYSAPAGLGPSDTLGDHSRNILKLAQSHSKAFRGITYVGKGSRILKQVKNGYGGLSDLISGASRIVGTISSGSNALSDAGAPFVIGDDGKAIQLKAAGPRGLDLLGYFKYVSATAGTIFSDAGLTVPLDASSAFVGNLHYSYGTWTRGAGGLFSHIAGSIFFGGSGQVTLNSADITGCIASSSLQLVLQRNGSYTASDSGPYIAGLSQPSAPLISPRAPSPGYSGLLTSPAESLKISALRSTTGAKSIASPTSAVISLTGEVMLAVIPLPQSGQDFWVFYAPFKGFGGVGIHYRFPVFGLLQVPETYFTRTVTDAVTNSTVTVTSATANFTSRDVGKQIVLSGGGSLTSAIKTVNSSTSVDLYAPASWSSSGNTAVVNAMVADTNPRRVTDAVTNGTTLLTSATAAWTDADVGKQIVLSGPVDATRTIASVTNATDVVMSALVAAHVAVTVDIVDVNGTLRAIQLEWQDGDLTTEAAPIDDYPPPAGTHPFSLSNVVCVGGCYSDASTGPTSDNPGTCIAVGLPNFPESFRPIDLLYLPEQIVDVLQRPTDSYCYVGCRNSVHIVQYVGGGIGPACTLTTLWPDVGIANPQGWCQANGLIFVATSRGGLVTIGALGLPDNTFSAPIREFIKDWDPRYTRVNWNPDTQQVVASNLGRCVAYSLQTGGWSSPTYYSDFEAGNALSAVQSGNQMYVTLDNAGTHELFSWNVGSGSTTLAMSQWIAGGGRTSTLWEYLERIRFDNAQSCYVSIHKNFRPQSNSTASMTSGDNLLTVTTANFFSAEDVNKWVLVLGAGVAGAPLLARVKTFVDGMNARLGDTTSAPPIAAIPNLNASTSVSGKLVVIGAYIYQRTPKTRVGYQLFQAKKWRVPEAWAIAVGVTIISTTGDAMALGVGVFGTPDGQAIGLTR